MVMRITALVGNADGNNMLIIPRLAYCLVIVTLPALKLYAAPVHTFVNVADNVPAVTSTGEPFSSTNWQT